MKYIFGALPGMTKGLSFESFYKMMYVLILFFHWLENVETLDIEQYTGSRC